MRRKTNALRQVSGEEMAISGGDFDPGTHIVSTGNKALSAKGRSPRFIYPPGEDSACKADCYFPFPYQIRDTAFFLLEIGQRPESASLPGRTKHPLCLWTLHP